MGNVPQAGQEQSVALERSGLGKVMWFGILQLVSIVSGWILAFYTLESIFVNTASLGLAQNSTPAQVSAAFSGVFHDMTLVIPVVVVIELAAMAMLVLGYWDLKRVDSRFSIPSILMILMIAGTAIVAGAAVMMLTGLSDVIAKAPSTTGATPSQDFLTAVGSLVLDFTLVAVGGLVAVAGFIGGQMLGLWRVGSRYDETLLKVGAILPIVPLLNIVAPILVILGASQARGKLQARPGGAMT